MHAHKSNGSSNPCVKFYRNYKGNIDMVRNVEPSKNMCYGISLFNRFYGECIIRKLYFGDFKTYSRNILDLFLKYNIYKMCIFRIIY